MNLAPPVRLVRCCTMLSPCGDCGTVVQTQYMSSLVREDTGTNIMCQHCYHDHLLAYRNTNGNEMKEESLITFMVSRNWVEIGEGTF